MATEGDFPSRSETRPDAEDSQNRPALCEIETTNWESAIRTLATGAAAPEREVARWALVELQKALGPLWLGRAQSGESRPALVAALERAPWHNVAFGEVVIAAALASAAMRMPGGDSWRKEVKNDPRAGRWAHSQLQAAVAASAVEAGFEARLEELRPESANPLDVTIYAESEVLSVETRVLGASVQAIAAHAAADAIMDRLNDAALRAGLSLAGHIRRIPGDHELENIEAWLDRTSATIRGPRRWRAGEIELEAWPFGANRRSLTGPLAQEPSLPRILSVLSEKAEKAEKSGADWLRVEVANGLWGATPWSRLGLRAKLDALESVLRGSVPALGRIGLVISSTRSMVAYAEPERVEVGASRGLRVAIAPFWARESMVLPAGGRQSSAVAVWERITGAESTWLSSSLRASGFSESVNELLGASPG